jgi:hypothetical protein
MRVVPARNGWSWLLTGFALFRKNPPMWLLLVFIYFFAELVFGQIRYLGPAAFMVLLPAFLVSFMVACAVLEHGGVLRPALLISGFRSAPSTLIVLGILNLLSIVGVLGLAPRRRGRAALDARAQPRRRLCATGAFHAR